MSYSYNKSLKTNAQQLRRSMTKEERKLWFEFLTTLPLHVRKQKMIGNYIVDFYCAKRKMVIEFDGSQHYERTGVESDKVRDEYLKSLGLTVLRYSNHEINSNFEGVCEDILRKLGLTE